MGFSTSGIHAYDRANDLMRIQASDGAALSDAMANPTTQLIGALGALWNGSNWARHANAVQAEASVYHVAASGPMIYDSPASGFTRLYTARSEGDAGSGQYILPVAGTAKNPSGTFDKLRTLAASDFGLGAQKVSGAPLTRQFTVTPTDTTLHNAWQSQVDDGIRERAVSVYNNTGVSVAFIFYLIDAYSVVMLQTQVTLATGTAATLTTAGWFNSVQATTGLSGISPAGTVPALNVPADATTMQYAANTGTVTGPLYITYHGRT